VLLNTERPGYSRWENIDRRRVGPQWISRNPSTWTPYTFEFDDRPLHVRVSCGSRAMCLARSGSPHNVLHSPGNIYILRRVSVKPGLWTGLTKIAVAIQS